jgi:hypothetical protein
MCVSIYTNKCNMQRLNSGFNKLKVNDLIHVKMLIVQKMWKNSLNHSNIIAKYWVTCVLVYYNKCKMQFVNNGFNILTVNSSTLIIEKMWKKSVIHSYINVGFKIVTCVLMNYGKCKCNSWAMVSTC